MFVCNERIFRFDWATGISVVSIQCTHHSQNPNIVQRGGELFVIQTHIHHVGTYFDTTQHLVDVTNGTTLVESLRSPQYVCLWHPSTSPPIPGRSIIDGSFLVVQVSCTYIIGSNRFRLASVPGPESLPSWSGSGAKLGEFMCVLELFARTNTTHHDLALLADPFVPIRFRQ